MAGMIFLAVVAVAAAACVVRLWVEFLPPKKPWRTINMDDRFLAWLRRSNVNDN